MDVVMVVQYKSNITKVAQQSSLTLEQDRAHVACLKRDRQRLLIRKG